ncbi:MAG: lipoprotein [Halothiobacillaceae bacterium]|nr:MAG: lipoprotein [Halothiobacillaceae bacterium]
MPLPLLWCLLLCLVMATNVPPVEAQSAAPTHNGAAKDPFADDTVDESDLAENSAESSNQPPLLEVSDPLERYNRGIFWLNDKFYFYLLKPVAKTYRYVPEGVRVSISNVFSNLTSPIRLVSSLLQGDINKAGNELGRFMINTTVGIGGLFDPARQYAGLRKREEDIGQALGRYGLKPGIYIVWPIIGPSNLRDSFGSAGDAFLDPSRLIWRGESYWAARSFNVVNTVSLDKETYENIKRSAFDPYLFIRDAYIQSRAQLIAE